MRCKGKITEKKKNGRTIEKTCNYELSKHAIFCPVCGQPTQALSGPLSAKKNHKSSWNSYKEKKSQYYPLAIFLIFVVFLPLLLVSIYNDNIAKLVNLTAYLVNNLTLLLLVPLSLLPFASSRDFIEHPLTIKNYFRNFKYYFHYLGLVLITILYFFILNVLCTGYLLNIMTDPILHPVRLILVLYWLVNILPAPLLIARKNMNPLRAIYVSHKASKETRWQQFFLILIVAFYNIIGLAIIGIGLIATIPYSYVIIEKYYQKMDEFELFDIDKT